MKGVISQPRYLPALNYLQRIYHSDVFVVLDDVQHQRRCVEHRNKIITDGKSEWLSASIDRILTSRPLIKDMHITKNFYQTHNNKINLSYRDAKYFDHNLYAKIYALEELHFVTYFIQTIKNIFSHLDLELPKIVLSSTLEQKSGGSKKIADLCKFFKIKEYISGPNGKNYLIQEDFTGINISFHNFSFPIYSQSTNEFIPWTAWIDCYFNEGKDFVRSIITDNMVLNNE